jgi:FkbH-like protein
LTESKIPFQKLIDVNPGFNRISIPFEELAGVMDLRSPFSAHITPNEVEDGSTLYFGLVDFVRGSPVKSPARKNLDAVKTLKCVVWDLDHTLWDGVLVEDGPEKLKLKPGVVEVIQELDRRGILQSVASKNDPEEALRVLRSHALEEYFLYPKISWEPKSDAIAAIARDLNIGMDTILFVDDSEFERQEVMSACPGVRVLDARLFRSLPDREECQVPVTGESAARRKMYQVEGSRQKVAESFGSDYMTFLSHCEIRLKITPLSEENLERVHELTQRTNQMNFSGNRYDRNVLHAIIGKPHLDTYVIACEDRFGSYGVVGFSIVDSREPRMTDLMFSCRIQSKRVEHAFLSFLIRKYRTRAAQDFLANYKKTSRNAPAGRVFPDLQMREIENQDGVSVWVFPKDQTPLDDGLVLIDAVDEAVRSC